jgi:alpha-tubulin suppressor-like RCC1 family protein
MIDISAPLAPRCSMTPEVSRRKGEKESGTMAQEQTVARAHAAALGPASTKRGGREAVRLRVGLALGTALVLVAISAFPGDAGAALPAGGAPWAWGWNLGGQLGRATQSETAPPAPVQDLADVAAVAAGALHSLALARDGTVWAWGGNTEGQLGSGAGRRGSPVPVRVPGLAQVVGLATGSVHDLALRADGTVWTWGSNAADELGTGTACTDTAQDACTRATPQRIGALPPIIAVAGGGIHSLALARDGTVWAWGANRSGQLGTETVCHHPMGGCASPLPRPVGGLPHVRAIAGGGEFSLALASDGVVWAWGANEAGQLGRAPATTVGCGPDPCSIQPQPVRGLPPITAIAAGDDHSLALDATGRVWTWGGNAAGQLGCSTWAASSSPRPLGLTGIVAVAGGRRSSAAVDGRGTLWTWGWNAFGQLGTATTVNSPVPLPLRGVGPVVALAQGSETMHRLVLVATPVPCVHDDSAQRGWACRIGIPGDEEGASDSAQ